MSVLLDRIMEGSMVLLPERYAAPDLLTVSLPSI